MIKIHIVCDDVDVPAITKALPDAFTVMDIRQARTFDDSKVRLYVTADHRPERGVWPTPEEAYANAPSINSEIGWTARFLADAECFTALDREFYLRKAALLDRIALLDDPDVFGDAAMTADAAALYLLDTDRDRLEPAVCTRAETDPRGYVRHEYARTLTDQ